MPRFSVPDPGTPDHRSATRYLWWIVRQQRRTVAFGMATGMIWMVSQAPYAALWRSWHGTAPDQDPRDHEVAVAETA